MIRFIFRGQLRSYFSSARFYAALVLAVLLGSINAIVYSQKYVSEQTQYHEAVSAHERELTQQDASPATAASVNFQLIIPPNRLAFLSGGRDDLFPSARSFNMRYPSFVWGPYSYDIIYNRNERLRYFDPIDWVWLVQVLFSFLVIVFTFDIVSGEREGGTLKLVLSHAVKRSDVVIGKISAALTVLLMILILAFLLNLVIVFVIRHIPIRVDDLGKIGAFLVLSIAYLLLFVALGVLISASVRHSITSLIILLFIWVSCIEVVPKVATLVITGAMRLPTEDELIRQIDQALAQMKKQYSGQVGIWRGRELGKTDGYKAERMSAQIENRLHQVAGQVLDDYLKRKLGQVHQVERLSSMSPAVLYATATRNLVSAGIERQERFISQIHGYIEHLMSWVQEVDSKDPESPHILYFSDYLSTKKISWSSVPRFQFREVRTLEITPAVITKITVLVLEALVLFVVALWRFLRYDVR